MKTNYQKIEDIFINNNKVITRRDLLSNNISSWFLSYFVKKNNLRKISPGVYADQSYPLDAYYLFQKRYKNFIFSGMSALYLNGLTDKIPDYLEVNGPYGYNPNKEKGNIFIHIKRDLNDYKLGIEIVKTPFGNKVQTYNIEKCICDLVKNKKNYESEIYFKTINEYFKRKDKNLKRLHEYAEKMKISDKINYIEEILNYAKSIKLDEIINV